MTNKFKVGEKVKFVYGSNENTETCPTYYIAPMIPERLLKHGSTIIGEKYSAEVVDIYNEYYIVSFINKNKRKMQLGFKAESLESLKVTNWRDRLESK